MRADDPAIVEGGVGEIERRLARGESVEVHLSRGAGWPTLATGVGLLVIYGGGLILVNAFMSGFAVVLAAIFAVPLMLMFLRLAWQGAGLLRTETSAFTLTPEGLVDRTRRGATRILRWEDILAADLEKGALRLELRPDFTVPRVERWAMRRALRKTGAGFYLLPAGSTTIDQNTLTEFVERRVEQEMLGG